MEARREEEEEKETSLIVAPPPPALAAAAPPIILASNVMVVVHVAGDGNDGGIFYIMSVCGDDGPEQRWWIMYLGCACVWVGGWVSMRRGEGLLLLNAGC